MIRVLLDTFPDDIAPEVINTNTVNVGGVNKAALYFDNRHHDLAASLGGEILTTE